MLTELDFSTSACLVTEVGELSASARDGETRAAINATVFMRFSSRRMRPALHGADHHGALATRGSIPDRPGKPQTIRRGACERISDAVVDRKHGYHRRMRLGLVGIVAIATSCYREATPTAPITPPPPPHVPGRVAASADPLAYLPTDADAVIAIDARAI